MALVPSDNGTTGQARTRSIGRFNGLGVDDLALVIGGAVVVMALVRFTPDIGGWALLAITLLLLRNLYMGGSI